MDQSTISNDLLDCSRKGYVHDYFLHTNKDLQICDANTTCGPHHGMTKQLEGVFLPKMWKN